MVAKASNYFIITVISVILTSIPVAAGEQFITLASSTSTDNSGFFNYLLPKFTATTNIKIRVVARGTGQAILLAQNGDADVLFVHHPPSEKEFIKNGFGIYRRNVMYNDFVIVGPDTDPANIGKTKNVIKAMISIAKSKSLFISRGDNSGTHKAELELWNLAAINVLEASGSWYRDTGSGMGSTLNIATASGGYTLSDRATWISFKNKGNTLILVEGDTRLFNQYGVIVVNQQRHPHVKLDHAKLFVEWLTSAEGQANINAFRIDGQQLFFANYSTKS